LYIVYFFIKIIRILIKNEYATRGEFNSNEVYATRDLFNSKNLYVKTTHGRRFPILRYFIVCTFENLFN